MKSIDRLIKIGPHLILLEVMPEIVGRPLTEKEEARGMNRQMAAMMIMLLHLSESDAAQLTDVLEADMDCVSEDSPVYVLLRTWDIMVRNAQYAQKFRASLDKP